MKISKSTIVRTIMIVLVIINFVLEKLGVDLIYTDEATVLMWVETIIEIGVIIAGFWYNNSYSENALKAQKYLNELKSNGGD